MRVRVRVHVHSQYTSKYTSAPDGGRTDPPQFAPRKGRRGGVRRGEERRVCVRARVSTIVRGCKDAPPPTPHLGCASEHRFSPRL